MWRAFKLVQGSGISYTLLVRGRPDATILEPLDLRALHDEMSNHLSVRRAGGHYIAIPERNPYTVVADVFAIGTMESIAAFASPPTAFSQEVYESYVERNLVWRGFVRSSDVLKEEMIDPRDDNRTVWKESWRLHKKEGSGELLGVFPWQVMDPSLRRGKFSALMSMDINFQGIGHTSCFLEGAACVPIYRTRLTYSLYTALKPWFSPGPYCIPEVTTVTRLECSFLVAARIATFERPTQPDAALSTRVSQLDNHNYCLDISGLSQARSESLALACNFLGDFSGLLSCHKYLGNHNRTWLDKNTSRYGLKASAALFWDESQWHSETGAILNSAFGKGLNQIS